ncbi:MAG: HigA family addiction module antidote protein [Exiguobacterium sp.]|nr:HigA family addiction module antidote protein [Exiguobacterium sp.]
MKSKKYILTPPVSPGEVLRKHILDSRITQESLSEAMNVSRFSVNQIVNGKRAVTPEMALRLAHVTSTTTDFWLNLQREVDLYLARKKIGAELSKLPVIRRPKKSAELFKDAQA